MQVIIYTDGACDIHAENQPGGWAAILRAIGENGDVAKETVISGGAESSTNNQMELRAVIEGLKALTQPTALTVVTDSRYVIDVASKNKKALKNKRLWQEFSRVADSHQISWKHVEGHAGDELNERCDRLAVAEKRKRAKPRPGAAAMPVEPPAGTAGIYLSTRYAPKDKATSWAAVIRMEAESRELCDRLEKTSESEGALIGAIKSLESLPTYQDATLFTAQEYLSKGMNQWLANWIAKGWKTRGGDPVKYRRHWERLRQLTVGRKVEFRFVKSRADIPDFDRGKELTAAVLKRT